MYPSTKMAIKMMSVISWNDFKLSTSMLHSRWKKLGGECSIISDAKFGFRNVLYTMNNEFVLHSIIENYLNKGKRVYFCLLDMLKCFDSVKGNSMKFEIKRKRLTMMRVMNEQVLHYNKCTDFMEISDGQKLGSTIWRFGVVLISTPWK